MSDARSPLLGKARNRRKVIGQTAGKEQATGRAFASIVERDQEAARLAADAHGSAGFDDSAVATDLVTSRCEQFERRPAISAQHAMHVGGDRIPRRTAVREQDSSA